MCDHLEAALPSTKSSRANAVHYTPTGPDRGTAIIDQTGKGKIAEYAIVEFHADGGRGFRISNRAGGADAYAVFLPFEELADSGMAFESRATAAASNGSATANISQPSGPSWTAV